ncbi:gastrin/cholecystokinin type B receptor [Megalops cyprinoides]|uniref:gastrin/cholecystokinin type B receptor n=1 Tax=Megalops cyprinoides TaxID=118141 RepID=UPI0018655E63|nr:gastrin/cholecystokinin type B receptor [Megalops cyprinoides]
MLVKWNLYVSIKVPGTIALVVMYTLSFIIGLGGNIMALLVLTRRKNRLASVSATRRLLINLAVCDMMVVCVCMPVNLGHQVYNAWVFGDFMCRAVPFVQAVSVSASVLSLAVISLNRYYSVHKPLHARSFFTGRKILCMICVVWTLSSGLCLPLIFMNRTKTLVLLDGKHAITVCVESWPKVKLRQGYNFLLFCALYGFPVLFNLVICFLTGRKLWSADEKFRECNKCNLAQSVSRQKVRKKIAKMVVALVVLFTLSWLPLYVIDIWIDFNMPNAHQWILQGRPFAQWLGLTNSALNPLCYCFVGNLYRSAQKIRKSYRAKLSSVFSVPLPQSSTSSSVPTLLSYSRASSEKCSVEMRTWRNYTGFSDSLAKSKSMSSVTVCETVFD